MKLNYDVTKEDYKKYFNKDFVKKKNIENRVGQKELFSSLLMVVLATGLLFSSLKHYIPGWMGIVLACILWVINELILTRTWAIQYEHKIVKDLDSGKYNDVIGNLTIDINEKNIEMILPTRATTIGWKSIRHLILTNDDIYIITTTDFPYVIPSNAFLDKEHRKTFTNHLIHMAYLGNGEIMILNTQY